MFAIFLDKRRFETYTLRIKSKHVFRNIVPKIRFVDVVFIRCSAKAAEKEVVVMSERVHNLPSYDPYLAETRKDQGIDIAAYGYSFESRRPRSAVSEPRRRSAARRKEHRANILLAVLLAVVIGLTGFVLGMRLSEKIAAAGAENTISYESVLIHDGDTLESIAKEKRSAGAPGLRAYVKEIAKVNGIDESSIHTGNYLIVPIYP